MSRNALLSGIGGEKNILGTSLVVQWLLGLCASTSGSLGLISDQGTKIPHTTRSMVKKKKHTHL